MRRARRLGRKMKRRRQAGIGLLIELLIAATVSSILLAMSSPYIVGLQRVANQQAAHQRVQQVSQAKVQLAICAMTTGCTPNAAVLALIPPVGSLQMNGYLFSYGDSGGASWQMTAQPTSSFTGVYSYYITSDGILRCVQNAPAGPSSPACN
jgi:type II secretory pathway pseudopilin PulG